VEIYDPMTIFILVFSDKHSRIFNAPGSVLLQYNKIIMHKWDEDTFVVVYSFHLRFLFLYTLTTSESYSKQG